MPPLPRLLPLTLGLTLLLAAAGVLSPHSAHAASPVLSEFMADNRSTLADEDGEFVDWIELSNPSTAPIDLTGYALTDDPKRPDRWLFPAVTLAPGEQIGRAHV